jgi:hypothetical protein
MPAPVTASIAALITPLIGRTVISTDKHNVETRYTIARLSDKVGTLKDGSKGEYVILTKDGETGTVINMHPNTAKKLAKTANADNFSLLIDLKTTQLPESTPAAEGAGEAKAEGAADLSADEQAAVNAEMQAEQAGEPAAEATSTEPAAGTAEAEAPKDEAPAAKEPRVTKKSQTVAIFKTLTAEGKPRKDIIAKMKTDLGLSDAGANTYYQNCKSGAWA